MSISRPILVSCGACALAAATLLGAAGAAARPGGFLVGLPAAGAVVAVTLAVGVVAATRAGRAQLARCAGLALPPLLLLAGAPLAGVAALSGPPLLVLAAAGAALVLASLAWRTPRLAFLPLVFVLFVCAGGRSSVRVGPQGDEPHYLMVADSLLRDHDLSLERDYAERRYAAFHDAPLAPHYRVRGRHGEIYSLHAVGLSVLILPAWALAGYPAVTVFMALLAALLVAEVRAWIVELGAGEGVAEATAWLFALSPPLLHYAGLVFTEIPAALGVAFALRRGRSERLSAGGSLAIGLAAAALPWLNVRYAPLALLLVAHAAWRQPRVRRVMMLLAPLVLSALGLALYHHALYGFWDPRRVYGSRPEMALSTLATGGPGSLLDQEFGLLVYAPFLVLAVPGLLRLVGRDLRLGVAAILSVASVVLTAGSWHMWRGGFNPPGRFLVPIVPILVVAVALVWERTGASAGALLLVGWGLFTGIGGALEPQLVHRDRDETAPFFRRLSGAREWTGLLPGYVLEHPDRNRLAAIWTLALLAAVPWRRRPVTTARFAGATLGFVLAAEAAALASTSQTADRDSTRIVGRPALAVPGWRIVWSSAGEWPLTALGWGPAYEPHRHPAGAPLGRRLPLPPGSYCLELRARELSAGEPPWLEWALDRPGAPWRQIRLAREAEGLSATFDVPQGAAAVNLQLRGGGPLVLTRLVLRAQPSGRGAV